MALVLTVPQLIDLSIGSIPEAFRGTVKKVNKPLEAKDRRPGDEGYWKMQKIVIADGGSEIELVFDHRADLEASATGHRIYVQAGAHSRTGAPCGLKRAEYQGNPQIKVFDSATVSLEGAAVDAASSYPSQPHVPLPPPPTTPLSPESALPPAAEEAAPASAAAASDQEAARVLEIKAAERRIGKTVAMYDRCVDAAVKLCQDVSRRHPGVFAQPADELIEKIAMGILVNSCWNQKPAEIKNFPIRPFHSYEKTPTVS
jgi:hypothetical protein